ncbi:MlaD family protein [Thermodesulfobacteriota bacterium]
MSQQANKALIGGFVIGALALVFAGVMVFGSGKFFQEKVKYVLYFESSLKGLNVGSPVVWSGVKIGSVTDIQLHADTSDLSIQAPVIIETERGRIKIRGDQAADPRKGMERLIKRGLRAQLLTQSLVTGQLLIDLDYHPDTPVKLADTQGLYPEIPTIPSSMETLSQTIKGLSLDELVDNLTAAVAGFERLINAPEVGESLRNLNQTIKDTQHLIRNADNRIGPIASGIEGALGDTRKLVRHLDDQIDPLAANVNNTLGDARKLLQNTDAQIAPLADSIRKTADAATEAVKQAEKTLVTAEELLGKDSTVMYQVTKTLKELSDAARSIRVWAEYLERHPEALVRGKR